MNALSKIPYLIFFVICSNKKNALKKIFFEKNSKKFLPVKFLMKNGLGKIIILCDRKAAPSSFDLGETKIRFNL